MTGCLEEGMLYSVKFLKWEADSLYPEGEIVGITMDQQQEDGK